MVRMVHAESDEPGQNEPSLQLLKTLSFIPLGVATVWRQVDQRKTKAESMEGRS